MRANRDWLLETNTLGKDSGARHIGSWTSGLMNYAAVQARHWSEEVRRDLIFDVLAAFSNDCFIEAAADLIIGSDLFYIEGNADDRAYLLSMRETIWPRLKLTHHWHSHLKCPRDSMESHLKRLIGAFYMCLSIGFFDGQRYTKGLSDAELTPFLPLLSEIASEASQCQTTALLYLDILECLEPTTAEASLAASARHWANNATSEFWTKFGIGNRVLKIGSMASALTDKVTWRTVCEALMESGVSVEGSFLNRLREETS